MSFAQLVRTDPDLAKARHECAAKSPADRRAAAQWEYDSAMADHLFDAALERIGGGRDLPAERRDAGVLALAIDPLYAPALLTVGSLEYQYGRVEAAMKLIMTLPSLPPDEPELVEIVDKAGDFLLDQKDDANALRLYEAAAENAPAVATYWSGVGYCLVRLGRKEDAVEAARRAATLEPKSALHLSDLGWSLLEAGAYAEARSVLEQAVALAPPGYDLPRHNLAELENRIGLSSPTAGRPTTAPRRGPRRVLAKGGRARGG